MPRALSGGARSSVMTGRVRGPPPRVSGLLVGDVVDAPARRAARTLFAFPRAMLARTTRTLRAPPFLLRGVCSDFLLVFSREPNT